MKGVQWGTPSSRKTTEVSEVGERRMGVKRVNTTEENVGGIHSSFRVILSAGTRSLKPAGLRLVTDEPRKVDLMKNPKGHRRNFPSQMRGS
jgi:hypothetical protein